MKRTSIAAVLGLSLLSGAPSTQDPLSLTYNVVAVKHKLLLEAPEGERRLQTGDSANSGDALRTGWRATAELAVPARSAVFHLGSSTRFRLAHDRPGVLLEIERGRLRAVFGPEEIGDGVPEERLVTTPSAVLAVRGTEYGIEVKKNGETSLVVFEGVVELKEVSGVGDPVMVRAGQICRVRVGKAPSPPQVHNVSPGDWDRGRGMQSPGQGSSMQSPMMGSDPGRSGASGSSGSSGSSSGGGGSKGRGL